MKILVDTHVVLWFFAGDQRLPRKYRDLVGTEDRQLYFSAASAAEISTKFTLRKLDLAKSPKELIPQMIDELRMTPLPIRVDHALAMTDLPLHHRDPFDRLLVAQSICEGIPILTGDKTIRRYDVKVIW